MAEVVNQRKSASSVISHQRGQEIAALSEKVFGRVPKRIAFPGGKNRAAFIVDMGDKPYVFAKRGKRGDARMEARVLRALEASGVTPKFKALATEWTIQEFVPGTRLPILLDATEKMSDREKLVSNALDALLVIYETARSEKLQNRMPTIGAKPDWFYNATGAAKRMSQDIKIRPPEIDRHWMTKAMAGRRNEFIKYDARPGNALAYGDKSVWFDWEDCGRGRQIEDLAFVMCDEWTMLDAQAETRLIRKYLPLFKGGSNLEEAERHLLIYGMTHIMVRLRMALKYRLRDGKWWDREYCLAGDKVGITPMETARLCDRALRWSQALPELAPYAPWINEIKGYFDIPEHVETLPGKQAA